MRNLELAIIAALQAGEKILEVYGLDNFVVEQKSDASPLTEADNKANTIIIGLLETSKIPIISEECKQIGFQARSKWNRFWLVDPLDGTKEFIKRNGEFTVNIAFIEYGKPLLGVIYAPVSKELYYGVVVDRKAFKVVVDFEVDNITDIFNKAKEIFPSKANREKIKIVGSRSHLSAATAQYIKAQDSIYDKVEMVSKGSSLKFCMVAEGTADVYPRFAPTMEWDTAAGQAICEAAGLKVLIKDTNLSLNYNKENLLNPFFIVMA